MAIGHCTHLWLKGMWPASALTDLVRGERPEMEVGAVEAFRVGAWTVLVAEREPALLALATSGALSDWAYVELEPDHDEWIVIDAVDQDSAPQSFGDTASTQRAIARLQRIVPLEVDELGHYVDWHYDLDVAVGTEGPQKLDAWGGLLVEHVPLALETRRPSGEGRSRSNDGNERSGSAAHRSFRQTGLALGFAAAAIGFATLLTHDGADSWTSKFMFFTVGGTVFWSMLFPFTKNSRPRNAWLRWLSGVGVLAALGALVAWVV